MDEVPLGNNVSSSNISELSLANHIDTFLASQGPLGIPDVLKILAGFDYRTDI